MDFRLSTPVLASNCWPATPQSMINEMFEKTRGQLQDLTGVIISSTTPDPSDQDKMWVKMLAGVPVGNFVFANGSWIWPVEGYDLSDRRFWRGVLANLPAKDGGEAGAATLTTGPFWEVDAEMDGRTAVGVGGLPSGATITPAQSGGSDVNTLATDNVPLHRHPVSLTEGTGVVAPAETGGFGVGPGSGSGPEDLQWRPTANSTAVGYTRTNEGASANPVSFTNMQPFIGGYWIKRTGRQYYRG